LGNPVVATTWLNRSVILFLFGRSNPTNRRTSTITTMAALPLAPRFSMCIRYRRPGAEPTLANTELVATPIEFKTKTRTISVSMPQVRGPKLAIDWFILDTRAETEEKERQSSLQLFSPCRTPGCKETHTVEMTWTLCFEMTRCGVYCDGHGRHHKAHTPL
jgi:hypothetical protein